jgi:HEAT repeat protein
MGWFGPNVKKLEERRDVNAVVKCLASQDPTVRKDAAEALGRLHDAAAIGPLIRALADPSRSVRNSISTALEALDPDWRAHDAVDDVAEEFVSKLKSSDPLERRAAVSALKRLPVQKALMPLIELLQDEDEEVRSDSALALGKLGDKRAVEPLINAVNDKCMDVQTSAAWALGSLRDRRAIPALLKLVRVDVSAYDERLKIGVRALGEIGAVEELISLLRADMPGVEHRAGEELRRLTKEDLSDASAWSSWWASSKRTFQLPPKRGSHFQLPIVFASPREICERVSADYGLSTLNSTRLAAAAIESLSKGQLEEGVERGLTIAGLSQPLGVLLQRLKGWERTSAIMELGVFERRALQKDRGRS